LTRFEFLHRAAALGILIFDLKFNSAQLSKSTEAFHSFARNGVAYKAMPFKLDKLFQRKICLVDLLVFGMQYSNLGRVAIGLSWCNISSPGGNCE
jgi:hypothetical protein